MTQPFKENDELERRVALVFESLQTRLSQDRNLFYAQAYTAEPLGEVLQNLNADPLAQSLSEEVYRVSYPAIHELFTRPGTFEYYLSVFRRIFGNNVEVEFTIPSPGVLEIDVEAAELLLSNFMAREIISDEYVYHEVVDEEGDNIVFQGAFGAKTPSEMDLLTKELSPSIIFTTSTLTIAE
jgi:hypothetical protein